jgi:hypothetical protein
MEGMLKMERASKESALCYTYIDRRALNNMYIHNIYLYTRSHRQ